MIRPGRPERTARIRLSAPRTHRGGPMAGSEDARITVTPNGPYHVTGSVPLVPLTIVTDDDDFSVDWGEGERTRPRPATTCADAADRRSLLSATGSATRTASTGRRLRAGRPTSSRRTRRSDPCSP